LVPTRLYYKDIHKVLEEVEVAGIAHITGGGLYENVPRIIGDGLCASIDASKIKFQALC
jgi:phosphoribosylformylglycinamidine cyclo-ligase